MLRRLCKRVLVLVILGAGSGVLEAGAQTGLATAQTNVATSAAEAEVWYKTAEYIFQHDTELQPIAGKLVARLNKNSLESFRRSLEDATKAEGKALKDSHVFTFQTSFKEIQAQQPSNPAALVAAIEASKLGTKRKDDQQFQVLMRSLAQTTGTGTALPANSDAAPAAGPAASSSVNALGIAPVAPDTIQPATPPYPKPAPGLWLWLALGTAGLSLLGVAILWNKLANTREKLDALRRTVEVLGQKPVGGSTSPPALTNALKQEITRQMDQRVAEKQAKAVVAPPAAALVEPTPAIEAVADELPSAYPRLRTQYVGEAPFNNIFPARALSDKPSTYSMFAIESSEEQPSQGTFTVVGNLASHVRDHRTILKPVCEYLNDDNPLGSEQRVIIEQPGVVRRRGDDWEVVQRARVRFE